MDAPLSPPTEAEVARLIAGLEVKRQYGIAMLVRIVWATGLPVTAIRVLRRGCLSPNWAETRVLWVGTTQGRYVPVQLSVHAAAAVDMAVAMSKSPDLLFPGVSGHAISCEQIADAVDDACHLQGIRPIRLRQLRGATTQIYAQGGVSYKTISRANAPALLRELN